jgi:hypothetical protein
LIPVLLMLAYPPGYPPAGPVQKAPVRASDADRDTTVDILCAAVGDGRLTLAELDKRVGAALSARARSELVALLADLPARPSRALAIGSADSSARRLPPPTRWSLIQSLIVVTGGCESPSGG